MQNWRKIVQCEHVFERRWRMGSYPQLIMIMQSFVDGTERPYVFHMCWTAGRTDKLRYLKNMALWFLEPKCDQDSWKGHRDHGNSTFDHNQANCCLAGAKPWTVPTPYTQVIDLKSK